MAVYFFKGHKNMNTDKLSLKRASLASLLSLLNLTVLPILGFFILLFIYKKTQPSTIDRYYVVLGIKTNLLAAVALFVMTSLMIIVGGFDSAMTWVFVISYFVFVHAMFILFATWAMVRSWTGNELKRQFL